MAVEQPRHFRPKDTETLIAALGLMKAPRKRDAAAIWRIDRHLEDPTRYVEHIIVPCRVEYLNQRTRATVADPSERARVRAKVALGQAVLTRRYVAER